MSAVQINLVYDPNKITVSNLSCGTKLATPIAPDNTPGNLVLDCADLTEHPVSNETFTAVTFTVTASSSLGSTVISLGDRTHALQNKDTEITLNKLGGTVQISSSASGSVLNFFFGSSAVSPGGSNSGTAKITAGTKAVKSAQIVLSYDASKMTLSNLRCGSEVTAVGNPYYGSGTANITCGTAAGNDGISGKTFDAALFDIQILSTASSGAATISFAPNTGLVDRDNLSILTTLNPGTFQIAQTGGSPTPTATARVTPTVTPTITPTVTPTMTPTVTPTATPVALPVTGSAVVDSTDALCTGKQSHCVLFTVDTGTLSSYASLVIRLPNGSDGRPIAIMCPSGLPAATKTYLGCTYESDALKEAVSKTTHKFPIGNLTESGQYTYTVYASDPTGVYAVGSAGPLTFNIAATNVPGDVNGDGCVGIQDLAQVAFNFRGPSSCTPNDAARTEAGADPQGDFNHDGCVNYMDFAIVASSRFSNTCFK
jgi:hypothetical protein